MLAAYVLDHCGDRFRRVHLVRRGVERSLILVQLAQRNVVQFVHRQGNHLIVCQPLNEDVGLQREIAIGFTQLGFQEGLIVLEGRDRRVVAGREIALQLRVIDGREGLRCAVSIEIDRAGDAANGDFYKCARRVFDIGLAGGEHCGNLPLARDGCPQAFRERCEIAMNQLEHGQSRDAAVAAGILAPIFDRLVVEQHALDAADQYFAVIAVAGAQLLRIHRFSAANASCRRASFRACPAALMSSTFES